jgi:CBS domain-containing protein
MRAIVVLFGLFCCTALLINAVPLTHQDQEDVRGAFLTSRPKEKPATSSNTSKPNRRRPRPVVADNKNTDSDNKTPNPDTKTPKHDNQGTKPAPVNAQRLGLGLTLFMRDANGLAVRTEPSHVFQKGDRVRVLLETNTDGYIYIFNTTNDGPPVMIYPDADLDEAGNYLQAHVPFEIPSSLAAEERLRWLAFDENAGNERLFFVFTKEPLKGLPIDDDLIALCRDSKSSCPVKPTADVWAQVEQQSKQPLQSSTSAQNGQPQTQVETQASARGLGLAKSDPQPTMIMMASSKTSTLVTTLDLIHK